MAVDRFGGTIIEQPRQGKDRFGGTILIDQPTLVDEYTAAYQEMGARIDPADYGPMKDVLDQDEFGNLQANTEAYAALDQPQREQANRAISGLNSGIDQEQASYDRAFGDANTYERFVTQTTAGLGASLSNLWKRVTGDEEGVQENVRDMNRLRATFDGKGGTIEDSARGAAESLGGAAFMAPTGVAGIIGKAIFDSYNDSKTAAIDSGMPEEDAAKYARGIGAIEGTVSALFQRIGLGGTENIVGKAPAWKGVREFAKQIFGELSEEEIISHSQSALDKLSDIDPNEWTLKEAGERSGKVALQSLMAVGAARGMVSAGDFAGRQWPSRKQAKELGISDAVSTAKARHDLAEGVRNQLTAEQFTEQLRTAATSPEEADALVEIYKARAASAGESFDGYVGKRLKGIQKTTKAEVEPLTSGVVRPDGRRGEIEFLEEGRAIIRAFETQTIGTLAHETGHLFRRDLLGDDLKAAERWAGARNGKWDNNSEEKFARGFERYLRDGTSPTPKLESVFAKFKDWLTQVYSKLTNSPLNLDISPEMRGVFDRLLTPADAHAEVAEIAETPQDSMRTMRTDEAAVPELFPNSPQSPLDNPDILSQAPVSPDLAAANASMDESRAAMGLPEINQPAAPGANMPHHVAEQEAIRQRIPERAAGIVMDYLSEKRKEPLNQLETAGLAVYGDRLNEVYARLSEDVNNLTLDEGERMTKAAEMERVEQDFDLLSRAMRQSGTAQSLAFSQRKHVVGSDYRPLAVESRATAAKGEKLTPKEKKKVKQAVDEHKAAEEKLAEQEKNEEAVTTKKRDKIKKEVKTIKEKIKEQKLPTDLTKYSRDLAKQFLAEGVIGRRELIDKVQKAVREVFPDTQRRQVIDAISGYGDFTELSKDEVSVRLRDLKGQLQQIGKLKDMSDGKAPAKTGMERRLPSDEERGLIKEVNEAKKEGGYEVTDPDKQLASALSTIKTRLRNQIKDLQDQIDSREKRIKTKKDSPADEESKRLTEERDELQKQFEDIFGKPEMTEAQRIANAEKAVQKSIDEYERRLAAGDFKPRPKRHSNPVPEKLAAMRDRATALRQKYAESNPNTAAIEAAKERLATLEAHLKAGTLPAANPRQETRNPAAKAIQQQLAEVRKQLSQSEPAQKARLLKTIGELQAKLQAGNFSLPEGAPRPVSAEIERLQYERDKARRKIRTEINALKPQTIWGHVSSPFNTARQVITTLDFPPVFRQGGFIAMGNPARAAKATAEGFKAMFSDFNARKSLQKINERPNAPLYARAKLYLADMDGSPSAREEAFVGRLVEKIPGVRAAVHASERNYTVFLNQLRADTFDAMAASLAKNGEPTMEEARAIAKFINVATGRGDFGGMEQAMTGLAPVFFSPRYVASRFQLLAGQPMYGGTAETRKLIAKEYGKFLAGTGVLMALAIAAGAEIEDDPTSADFGKLKFGNTRLDPLGGLSQTAVIASRMTAGAKKTVDSWVSGKPRETEFLKDEGRMAWNFLRSKFSPIAALPINMATGQTAGQEVVTPSQIAKDMSVPLSFRDVKKTVEEQGVPGGVAMWLVSLFGMGMQTYEDN